ncbi:aldose 1-epimerase family protein [Flavobacterium sp.]|uniref:aldose 1-epimerase family protein n=1 Tax=Flavobacterium sp. TaxID=239 RepID=UPI0026043C36|nr:aldose 1-epimerase family protein [Flavobacterium sp.]
MEIHIQNQNTSATINSIGAELINLNKGAVNYIWENNENFWNKTSPVLFPIVGQLKNDTYTLNQTKYSLPRHGFARNYEFDVIQKTETSVTFSLSENEETLLQYPFHFELQISYTLEENKLNISYSVKNNSNTQMPFSLGAHPAFAIDSDFENYTLEFENDTKLVINELENGLFSGKTKELILENKKVQLTDALFEKDALVLKEFKSKYLTILKNNNPYLKVIFERFPHLGIWTKPKAPFLCIEPWQGFADSIDSNGNILEKQGIQTIPENDVFKTSFSIEIL